MPDLYGLFQLIAFRFKWANWPQITWKSVLHQYCTLAKAQERIVTSFRDDSGA